MIGQSFDWPAALVKGWKGYLCFEDKRELMNGFWFTLSKILGQLGAGLQSFKFFCIPWKMRHKLEQQVLLKTHMAKGELHSLSILDSQSIRTFTKPKNNSYGEENDKKNNDFFL